MASWISASLAAASTAPGVSSKPKRMLSLTVACKLQTIFEVRSVYAVTNRTIMTNRSHHGLLEHDGHVVSEARQ